MNHLTVLNRVALLTLILLVRLSSAQTPQNGPEYDAFRNVYPFHVQGIALGKPHPDGQRVLIIAEPPPKTNFHEIKAINEKVLDNLVSVKHQIGYDGWVQDIIITLPPTSMQELIQVIEDLHKLLFGTSYKAYLLPFESPQLPPRRPALDLHIAAPDLAKWLLTDAPVSQFLTAKLAVLATLLMIVSWRVLVITQRRQIALREGVLIAMVSGLFFSILFYSTKSVFPLRFTTSNDQSFMAARDILRQAKPGVFFSSVPGIVLWSIPRAEPITTYPQFARQFVLDSDLIIGAVASDKDLLIVGRERQVAIEWLPPLRMETVFLLASLNIDELGQSFERTELIAGRLKRGDDWAPIYLTSALVDTEFGSQLNIADQILKSWSQHGTVNYANFPYPPPSDFPFSKPLSDEVRTDELIFNWNTKGLGYVSTVGSYSIYALNRTGALPVDYYSNSNKELKAAENQAYEYFAAQSDPTLVRVVQYTALYEIFSRFEISRPKDIGKQPDFVVPSGVMNEIFRLLVQLEIIQKSDLHRVELKLRSAGLNAHLDPLLDARDAVRLVVLKGGERGMQRLARALVYPRDFLTRIRTSPNTNDEDAALAIACQLLSENHFLVQILFRINTDSAFQSYVSDREHRSASLWLQTPSVVLSHGRPETIGGHNIAVTNIEYQTDSAITEGHIRIEEKEGRRIIFYNELDQSKIQRSVYEASRNDGASSTALEELIRNDLKIPAPAQRSYVEVLGLNGAGNHRVQRGFQTQSLSEIVGDK